MAIEKSKKGPGPREAALREMREARADDLRGRVKAKVRAKMEKVKAKVKDRIAAKRAGRGR